MGTRSISSDWSELGFIVKHQFVAHELCDQLEAAATRLAAEPTAEIVVRHENSAPGSLAPSGCVSKLFRLHRYEPAFGELCQLPDLLELLGDLVGPDVDVFLSQAVFKFPGALGQPLHQDAAIFPFDPSRPVVGVWIPLTRASSDSSRLEVQPRSHLLDALPHDSDDADRNGGRYLTIVGDEPRYTTVLDLNRGDAVVFDSHLLHASTDNLSDLLRVAAVLHFARTGTVDNTARVFGGNPYNDWMPVLRDGEPATREQHRHRAAT